MSFDCWLYLTVIAKDAEGEYERFVSLPFPPFTGLRLSFDNGDDERSSWFDVDEIEYAVDHDVFWLHSTINIGDDGCCCEPSDECCVLSSANIPGPTWKETMVRRGEERRVEFPEMFDPDLTLGKKFDRELASQNGSK